MISLTEISSLEPVKIRSIHTVCRTTLRKKREGTCLAFIQDYLCMSAELSAELRHTVPLTLPPSLTLPPVKPRVLTPRVELSGCGTGTPVQLFC